MTKKYKAIFSSFHTLYRLSSSMTDLKTFLTGVCRLYRNIFQAEKIILICRTSNKYIKLRFQGNKHYLKQGTKSILTKREKEILNQNQAYLLNNRMVYPFVFVDFLGSIYIRRYGKNEYFDDLEKKWFIALSEQVSTFLKLSSLYEEQRKIMINYIKFIARLLETYVPTSRLHSKSVYKLIRELGKEIKLSSSQIHSLEYAMVLHDAGKINIPSNLLTKESPLTEEEFQIIKKHPHAGANLIKDLKALKPVAPIILHHHERYDGKGYPSKLKKTQIPLGSRILAVIDAFDAMFFGRPYKKRMSLEHVENELKKETGKQFDPEIIRSFLKILKKKSIRKYLNSCR